MDSEKSEEVFELLLERGEELVLRTDAMREDESGGVGGACGEQVEEVGGVAGVSRGERGKAVESEGERVGESCV